MAKEQEFTYLSIKDEMKLSETERIKYYEELRKNLLHRKLTNTTPGALTVAPKLKKFVNKLDSFVTKILAGGDIERVTDGLENIPDGPCIFASTHQGLLDNLCWIPSCPKHCVFLHAADVDKFLIQIQLCTGLILVEKNSNNEKSRNSSKLDMIQILLKGHSVWSYPEGAWNLSPNKFHQPMRFGILDVAKKAGVPVVPVCIEFTYDTSIEKEKITKMHIRYGKPIYISLTDKLDKKLEEYKESISTIRWNLIEEKGVFKRSEYSDTEYINYLKGNIKNLAMKNKSLTGREMLDLENASFYKSDDEFYKFHHMNEIPFDENDEFLEPEEIRRLKNLTPNKNNAFLFDKRLI